MNLYPRRFGHPVYHDLNDEEPEELVKSYRPKGPDYVVGFEIKWDLETDFQTFHDITDVEFRNGLVVKVAEVSVLQRFMCEPHQYRPSNFWNTPCPEKTAAILHNIENGVSLTPPWLVIGFTGTLSVRSGHNRFAVGFINHSGRMPILLTPSDGEKYDRWIERAV